MKLNFAGGINSFYLIRIPEHCLFTISFRTFPRTRIIFKRPLTGAEFKRSIAESGVEKCSIERICSPLRRFGFVRMSAYVLFDVCVCECSEWKLVVSRINYLNLIRIISDSP